MPPNTQTVDRVDARRLVQLEGLIARGLETFVEVGKALLEIRDSRLYRGSHATWEAYCRERWSWSKTHANRQIDAAQVAIHLTPMGVSPLTERVARELAPLQAEPEKVRDAWDSILQQHGPEPTAEQAREVVRSGMDVHYSSATDDWATPQDLFNVLHAEFHFELDVCASDRNAKAARYFTEKDDGLTKEWSGVCWMNPPYGEAIPAWIRKAWESAESGATVVCLVPARVDTRWWWDYCRFGEIRFLRGRLRFGGADASAPFPSAVVVFPRSPLVRWWEWQTA